MNELYKDTISVSIATLTEKVYEIITNIGKIRVWEPSHNLPLVVHEWIPCEGVLKTGNIFKIKSPLWTFVAKCIELRENEVKWKFIEGPLKGTESWIVKPAENGCTIFKLLEYEVTKSSDRVLWQIFGRRIHSWASSKQLRNIKKLAELNLIGRC